MHLAPVPPLLIGDLLEALQTSGLMAWQICWSLVLGFALSATVQALVRRELIVRHLGDDRPATLAKATGLGIASSSCSYAAAALARSLFRRGASFTSAMVFQVASTNLVVELGIILTLLLGWQFTLAEFVGGPIIIVLVALAFRVVLRPGMVEQAKEQADRAVAGSMEGHASMDMSVEGEGSFWQRLFSGPGYTSVAQIFVMEWAAVIRDIVLGLLVAGAVAAWVPSSFWEHLFLTDDPLGSRLWGPVIGPVVAVLSFVCSVGNVPLAVVLYGSGISFGGLVAFLFADLIIVPLLLIYRKYYGTRMALTLLGVLLTTMVAAGYLVELIFGALHLVPDHDQAKVPDAAITWNYTTWLNLIALAVTAALVTRFLRTGGREMLENMGGDPS